MLDAIIQFIALHMKEEADLTSYSGKEISKSKQ
jgi:hypothetical protein